MFVAPHAVFVHVVEFGPGSAVQPKSDPLVRHR